VEQVYAVGDAAEVLQGPGREEPRERTAAERAVETSTEERTATASSPPLEICGSVTWTTIQHAT